MRKPALLLLVLAACGSSGGLPFTTNTEVAFHPQTLADGGPNPSELLVVLAQVDQGPIDCAQSVDGGILNFTGQGLSIDVIRLDGAAVGIGTYPVVESPHGFDGGAVAGVYQFDFDAGRSTFTYIGTSGTVTITAVGASITGSFSVKMDQFTEGLVGSYNASGDWTASLCLP